MNASMNFHNVYSVTSQCVDGDKHPYTVIQIESRSGDETISIYLHPDYEFEDRKPIKVEEKS